jgi:hypothetical protein
MDRIVTSSGAPDENAPPTCPDATSLGNRGAHRRFTHYWGKVTANVTSFCSGQRRLTPATAPAHAGGAFLCAERSPAARPRCDRIQSYLNEMRGMRSTQQFSITLPNEMADAVKAKVAVANTRQRAR